MENKLQIMKEYVQKLNEASSAYYNGKNEIMTDYEWDAMFDALKQLEQETGTILEDSPTIQVSKDETIGEKEPHEFLALSLAKTKKIEDLVKWSENRPIWISWKLDGLTLVVTYDHGRLTKVVTRGDGIIGTNITHLASAIYGIPTTIQEKGHLVIRGEAIISYEDFNAFVLETGGDYANPRNLASGSLSLKDVNEVKQRNIHWLPFTLVYTEKNIVSWGERMDYLEQLGFEVIERSFIQHPTYEAINEEIQIYTNKVTEGKNPYPVDGLVIDYDDTEYAATGSVTGHHATKAGYAFKWADEASQTELEYIEWSCAASTITPVAVFQQVEIEGTKVKRASLCNISECKRLGIGDKGTVIDVIKANKIIPKVIHVQKKVGELLIPSVCPVCGKPTEIKKSLTSETETLRCTNDDCAAKKLKRFKRFVSKAGMDIDGISEQTLSRFINEGWIQSYVDIYHLVNHIDEIRELDGFGDKSATNIEASLMKSKKVKDRKLLYALNIPLVGVDVAKKLLSQYDLDELVQIAEKTEDLEVFSAIEGIGKEKSSAFVSWFKDSKNNQEYHDLIRELEIEAEEKNAIGKLCEGLTFVVTGDVNHYKNRKELQAYIESQGGKVTGSVTKKTNYLINNDIESTSSKNQNARKLNIPIISEDEFITKFTQ